MSRTDQLFAKKKSGVLSVYFTAGYPALDQTLLIMKSLQDAGADMIELGMPYSDPLADGPVIQASSAVALANGMTIETLFEQIRDFRKHIHLPVLLMGYLNPILQYGFERFCKDAGDAGIDGLILPDLPMYEFEKEYGETIKKYGLDMVFLITPETSPDRVICLDKLSSGFLYAVSSSSTTGSEAKNPDQTSYFEKLRSMKLNNPVMIGFGIKDKASFSNACSYANGAIIGTAYIRVLNQAKNDDITLLTKNFIQSLK